MASLGSISTSGLNFSGLATGIDTSKIIDGLTAISQKRIDALKAQQADYASQQTTFAALQGKLYDLQAKTNQLARAAGGAFDARTATSSDDTAVSVAAGTAAVPGTYSLTVNALAQANQVASQNFADPNAVLKQGTMTVQVGGGSAVTVTLDGRNNTLQGLSDAINAAGGDVRASVINDGSATPYRLLLTATKTGAANAITVTNNLTAGTGADIDPTKSTVQAAGDARVTIGTGTGALTVSSGTNTVTGLIPGVSLNLLRADATKPVSLTVANDVDTATKAVQDFVDSYNDVRDFIDQRSTFDQDTKTAGSLLGNRDTAGLENDLAAALTATIPGLSSAANRLSSVGLSFGDDGKLNLDSGQLGRALSGATGATAADLKRLFGWAGTSDNPGLQFVLASDKTQPSTGAGYQVQVTTPATRATVVASGPPATSIVVSPPTNSLQIKLNGLAAAGVTIDAGAYTPDQIVGLLQQQINSASALNGNTVAVGLDSAGRIQITSQQYGSGSQVSFEGGGDLLSALGFTGKESATGTNVSGGFLVNGQLETATGAGQVLTGSAGNANTDGLQVRSTLATAGTGNLTITQGLAGRLNQVLNKYLDPVGGRLKTINDGFQKNIQDIDATVTKQTDLLQSKTEQLQLQFASMETAVNNLKGLQTQLSSLVTTK